MPCPKTYPRKYYGSHKDEMEELLEEIPKRIGRKVTRPEEVEDFEKFKAEI